MQRYKRGTIAEESPWLVQYLVNKENKDIHAGSARKVDWLCPNCGNVVSSKAVNKVVDRNHIPCSLCSDGVSKAEKVVSSALVQTGVRYVAQMTFPWSGRKRYDFYLPDYNAIIEVHGSQHYGLGFRDLSGVSLDQQQKNDALKQTVASENGIYRYFIINATNTDAINIVSQLSPILASLNIISMISYIDCEKDAMQSNIVLAAKLWNDGCMTGEISDRLGVKVGAVIKYLKTAAQIGLCDYSPYKAHIKSQEMAVDNLKKKVLCVTTGVVFDSLHDAKRAYNISSASNIIRACNDSKKHAGRFNGELLSWEYCT